MKKLLSAKKLLFLIAFFLPLYLVRFSLFSIPTNILEILILFAFGFSVYENKLSAAKFMQQHKKYFYPILLILLGLALSTGANGNYLAGMGIIKSWFIIPLLFAFSLLNSIQKKSEMETTMKFFYASTFIVSLIGIFYFLDGNLTYDMRLKAFYLSPNHLAMFLAPGLIFGIWHLAFGSGKTAIQDKKSVSLMCRLYTRCAYLIVLIIIGIAFYLTYSYASWISVVSSFAIINIIGKVNQKRLLPIKKHWLLVSIAIISLVVLSQWHNSKFQDLATFDGRSSLSSRTMIWKSAVKIITDNPFFGIGPGNFQDKYLEYQKYFPPYLEWAVPQPHNIYLAFWLQSGILGLLGFMFLITLWIKPILSALRHQKSAFLLLENALLGIMLYTLIHGILDTPYWKNDLAVIFWMVFILGISAQKAKLEPSVRP